MEHKIKALTSKSTEENAELFGTADVTGQFIRKMRKLML